MSTTRTLRKQDFKKETSGESYTSELNNHDDSLQNVLKKAELIIELKQGEDDHVFDTLLVTMNDYLQKLDNFAGKAADELLNLFNDEWNQDEEQVDRKEFASRLKLESLIVRSSGSEVFFDDGELFQGHVIVVNLDSEGNVESAEIAG